MKNLFKISNVVKTFVLAILLISVVSTSNAFASTTSTSKSISKLSISKIADISATINQGDKYALPSTVTAKMSDGSNKNVSIVWNSKVVDTKKVGTVTYTGTVSGYSKKVKLTTRVK